MEVDHVGLGFNAMCKNWAWEQTWWRVFGGTTARLQHLPVHVQLGLELKPGKVRLQHPLEHVRIRDSGRLGRVRPEHLPENARISSGGKVRQDSSRDFPE